MMLLNTASFFLALAASFSHAAVVEKKDLASTILADIESATTCAACDVRKSYTGARMTTIVVDARPATRPPLRLLLTSLQAILVLLKGIAELGNTLFVDTFTELCILSKASKSQFQARGFKLMVLDRRFRCLYRSSCAGRPHHRE